jgi:1-acyl-sn-glycerol-3-phosphate acyltransferase
MKLLATVVGAARFGMALLVLVVFSLLIVLTIWIPLAFGGARIAAWLTTLAARLAMVVFNVRYRCADPAAIRGHRGLIFPNHISYFDILMLVHTLPLRFLSAIENKSMPLIGIVATAIGTVFVDRGEKASRMESRRQIGAAPLHPALVLFPEGGIGPGGTLEPFRYGAFEIAIASGKAFLPVVIQYSRPEVILWDWRHGETMWAALWKLARYVGPAITATATPLAPVVSAPGDDGAALAVRAHRAMAEALGYPSRMG